MSIEKKLLGTNPASGDKANIEDVFSTYLYDGTGSSQTITNGIDLAGEGGLVWIKAREDSMTHALFDTERGVHELLATNTTAGEDNKNTSLTAFNSNGFTLGSAYEVNEAAPNEAHASWTFRKRERFFDCVTYIGNGTAGREISHSLGVSPGIVVVKLLNNESDWRVYHRSLSATKRILLNGTAPAVTNGEWDSTEPTDSVFTVGGSGLDVNDSGNSYVAYLFAHDPDGENDDGMIACGSVTLDGTGHADVVLGWEPQYILTKMSSNASNWEIIDKMRGWGGSRNVLYEMLYANLSSAESANNDNSAIHPDGFHIGGSSNNTYIYMAIRAPMMKEPETGSEVFQSYDCDDNTDHYPEFISDFPVDMAIFKQTGGGDTVVASRMTGATKAMYANTSAAQITFGSALVFDYMNGFYETNLNNEHAWMFKRAKGCFDVCAYSGTGSPNDHGPTINHSLGVTPEFVIVKRRDGTSNWAVSVKVGTGGVQGYLDFNNGNVGTLATTGHSGAVWSDYFSDTQIIGDGGSGGAYYSAFPVTHLNYAGRDFIMYLFATLAGVSKVGNYTGNGSNQNIACGFSGGARFVLIKRTNADGDWYIWDTVRGIVSGNDPHLSLNTTSAEVTSDDSIDPQSAGFTVNQVSATNINVSSATYIFLAIA